MSRRILAFGPGGAEGRTDELSEEEPLEIRVNGEPVSITMRTPGDDLELALGFLYGEGLLAALPHEAGEDARGPRACAWPDSASARPDASREGPPLGPRASSPAATWSRQSEAHNIIDVSLDAPFDPDRLQRHFYASSSCGVCGKSSLKALATLATPIRSDMRVSAATLRGLPAKLEAAQATFARTGSLHATGIFTAGGDLVCAFEDVGRHNAVDKAIGSCLVRRRLPLDGHIMLVSGRTSFEILQKAAVARIPVVAAISGPSTLAADLADAFGITLAGFLRGDRFNVYSHAERIES